MKFKISSALKDHIGKELITDDNVAILELVKNSYDAGAKRVDVIFQDMRSDKPKIYVADNGEGMSKEDIESKWLFVGYSEKKDIQNLLKMKKRMMAGQKGIGRFSCDRLGSKLKIMTKVKTDKKFNVLRLDWNNFEKDQTKEFQSIPVNLEEEENIDKKFNFIRSSGTIVEILDLRAEWDREKMLKLKRYLQRLINPIQVDEKDEFLITLIAEDFKIGDLKEKDDYNKVNGLVINRVYETLGLKTTTISCDISSDGKKIITKLNDKGIDIFELEEDNKKFNLLKNIKIKLSFLNRNARDVFTRLMGVRTTDYGNIFLFKNGFRILPYGERDNDWLKLNDRKAQGNRRYLGTRELLGRIEINGEQQEFREVTSRSEGLVSTKAYYELKEFFMIALKRLEKYVVGAIDWDSEREGDPTRSKKDFESIKRDAKEIIKQIAGSLENKKLKYNKDFLEIVEERTIEKIPEVIKNIEAVSKKEKDPEIKEIYFQQIKSLKQGLKFQKEKHSEEVKEKDEIIKETEKKVKETEENLKIINTQNLFLKSVQQQDYEQLISLFHHIGIHCDSITSFISKLVKISKENNLPKEFVEYLGDINFLNNQICIISKIGHKGGITKQMQSEKQDLVIFILEFLENICKRYYDRIKVDYTNNFSKPFIKEFVPFELTYLLDNFISNSKKAHARQINFLLKEVRGNLVIEITDDGNGLDSHIKNPQDIFNRNVSYTGGSGLGLYDAVQILNSINGSIKVERREIGIKFIIEIKNGANL